MDPFFQYLPLTVGFEAECFTALPTEVENNHSGHLYYLQHHFRSLGLKLNPDPATSRADYSQFTITHDGSLQLEQQHITSDIAFELGLTVDEARQWSAFGSELVSPPLPAPDHRVPAHALNQPRWKRVQQYIAASTQGARHQSFVTRQCGFHMHFGLPNNAPLPLDVLQHLAILLLKYEDIITSLHHHSRNRNTFCRSNRMAFLRDGHTCHPDPEKVMNMTMIRNRIFEPGMTLLFLAGQMSADYLLDADGKEIPPVDSYYTPEGLEWEQKMEERKREFEWDGQTMLALERVLEKEKKSKVPSKEGNVGLMAKYKIMRWELVARHESEGPRTVEFRQPMGTLDEEEIGMAVLFYTSLIRAAERMAGGRQVVKDEEEATLERLLGHLQLSEAVAEYWRVRAARLKMERIEAGVDEEMLTAAQRCVLCAAPGGDGTYEGRKGYERKIVDQTRRENLERSNCGEDAWETTACERTAWSNNTWVEVENEKEEEWQKVQWHQESAGQELEGVQW